MRNRDRNSHIRGSIHHNIICLTFYFLDCYTFSVVYLNFLWQMIPAIGKTMSIFDDTFIDINNKSHLRQVIWPYLNMQQKTPQTCCKNFVNFIGMLQLFNKLQQTPQFHQIATSVLKSGLLQLVICRLVQYNLLKQLIASL